PLDPDLPRSFPAGAGRRRRLRLPVDARTHRAEETGRRAGGEGAPSRDAPRGRERAGRGKGGEEGRAGRESRAAQESRGEAGSRQEARSPAGGKGRGAAAPGGRRAPAGAAHRARGLDRGARRRRAPADLLAQSRGHGARGAGAAAVYPGDRQRAVRARDLRRPAHRPAALRQGRSRAPDPAMNAPGVRSARRLSRRVEVGGVVLGGGAPVVVQSMTNTDTEDVQATARQVEELARAGSELVRITVNTPEAAAQVAKIRARLDAVGCRVPLVGDFHYNGHKLLAEFPECARAL